MKRPVLIAAIFVTSISIHCRAQEATVRLNNIDSNIPIMYMASPVSIAQPAPQTVSVQLLGGPSASQLQPVTIAGSTVSVIPISSTPGFFDGGVGVVPGVTAGATATFELIVFLGTVPYFSPTATAMWTQATGSWDDTVTPAQSATGPTLQIPGGIPNGTPIVVVLPEPSTIALGLLGLGALFVHRRRSGLR
jgi:MYXO-CTERM domain-containing protein